MKLETNFVRPVSAGVPVIGLLLWSTSVLAIIVTMWLLKTVDGLQLENQELRVRLDQLVQRQEAKDSLPKKHPSKQLMADLHNRVNAVNSLPGSQAQNISSHLARFERLLPKDAYFLRLHHEQKRRQVTLIAESPSINSLTEFLRKLESDPAIKDVLLQKQRQLSDDDYSRLQFEILITELD